VSQPGSNFITCPATDIKNGLPAALRAWLLGAVLAASVGTISCRGRVQVRQSPSPPHPQAELLYERPSDSHREGLFSNTGQGRQQAGADQFIMPDAVVITALRWYGYRNCYLNPGTTQPFEISFFLDKEGLPAGEPIYTRLAPARISETKTDVTDSFGNHFGVYAYSAEFLPPLSIPAGRRTWVSVSQGFAYCSFLWNRSSSVDGETGAAGIQDIDDSGRFSNWQPLKDHLAFSLYGLKQIE
jgi:hypothetical protein